MFLCAAELKLFLCSSYGCEAPTLSEDLSNGQQAPAHHHVLQLSLELLANPKVCNCRPNIYKFVSLTPQMSVFVTFHPYSRTYASLWQLSGCSSSGMCIRQQTVTFLHLQTFACRGRQRKRNKQNRAWVREPPHSWMMQTRALEGWSQRGTPLNSNSIFL